MAPLAMLRGASVCGRIVASGAAGAEIGAPGVSLAGRAIHNGTGNVGTGEGAYGVTVNGITMPAA